MREQLKVTSASENCMVFADGTRREVRVVYEPNGKPLFCATDLAACMGYGAPTKAVMRTEIEPKYRRFVPWVSTKKRGRSEAICYDVGGVNQFLRHGVPSEECERWIREELIPEAEDIGARRGYAYEEPDKEPATEEPGLPRRPQRMNPAAVLERLDSIILEAVMLKQEITRST